MMTHSSVIWMGLFRLSVSAGRSIQFNNPTKLDNIREETSIRYDTWRVHSTSLGIRLISQPPNYLLHLCTMGTNDPRMTQTPEIDR